MSHGRFALQMLRASPAPSVVALIASAAALIAGAPPSQVADPAVTIDGDAAMITLAIKPDRAADFDAVLATARAVLARSQNPQRKAQAAGWQVFKSEEMVQGNVTYLMRLDPAVRGADYSLAAIIGEDTAAEAAAARKLLREIVVGQSVIGLSAVAVSGLGDAGAAVADLPGAADPRLPVLSFDTAQAAVITILIRQERESDFTAALAYLGKALQASPAPTRRRQAGGWKVLRGSELLGGHVVYVMSLDPVVPRAEYDLIRLIQETFPNEVDAIFQRYRAAYVGQAVSRLTGRVEMSRE